MDNNFVNLNTALQKQKIKDSQSQDNTLSKNTQANNQNETQQAAKELSDYFSTHVLEMMFKEQRPDDLFSGGFAEEMVQSFLLAEYGKNITKNDSFKFQEQFQAELIKIQSK